MAKSTKTARKPRLTDAERHARFVDMAREVEADESTDAFDKAFRKIAQTKGESNGRKTPQQKR